MNISLLGKSLAAGLLVVGIVGATSVLSRREPAPRQTITPSENSATDVASSAFSSIPSRPDSSSAPAASPSSQGFARSSHVLASDGNISGRWHSPSTSSPSSSATQSTSLTATSSAASQPAIPSLMATSSAPVGSYASSGLAVVPDDIDVVEQAPLPVSAQLSGYEVEGLTVEEQHAVNDAQSRFSDDVGAAPNQDTSDPSYYDDWEKARRGNDNYLRSVLGWRTFNGLSAEGAQAMLEQQRSAAPAH